MLWGRHGGALGGGCSPRARPRPTVYCHALPKYSHSEALASKNVAITIQTISNNTSCCIIITMNKYTFSSVQFN